jgi:hypothetical protein
MDLFNTKALAAANSRCAALEREITHLQSDRDMMAHNIRQMDDLIFAMSQCSDWNQMRPHFLALQGRMEARRQRESDRIQSVIFNELNKA